MVRPAVKELKKSEAMNMNKSIVDELVHGAGTKNKKKYIVNIMFDPEWETDIRKKAKEKGLTVSGYIKSLVSSDLKQ